MIAEGDETLVNKMKEAGIQVTEPDAAEFRAAVESVWDDYEDSFGTELMDLVREYSGS